MCGSDVPQFDLLPRPVVRLVGYRMSPARFTVSCRMRGRLPRTKNSAAITRLRMACKIVVAYPTAMEFMIRNGLSALIAAFVAISVLLAPANAAAMFACVEPVSEHVAWTDHHADVDGHAHSAVGEAELDRSGVNGHPDLHCSGHSCVVAVTGFGGAAHDMIYAVASGRQSFDPSLVEQSSPEGPRRPPRL